MSPHARRTTRNQESSPPTARVALLAGFHAGLEDALAGLLEDADVRVVRLPSITERDPVAGRVPDLIIASDACDPEAILRLVGMYGKPRRTRVVVLLAGHDPALERIYRDAGLKAILTMPVSAKDLIKAAQLK